MNWSLQTLDIVAENPDKFRIVALAAGSNVTLLADQVNYDKPWILKCKNWLESLGLFDPHKYDLYKHLCPSTFYLDCMIQDVVCCHFIMLVAVL